MRRWRAAGVPLGLGIAGLIVLTLLLRFLAPDLAYQASDRGRELLSRGGSRRFRVALGAASGSSYEAGTVLNRYLRARAGYELDLVVTASPGNVGVLLDPGEHIDLATISSTDDDAIRTAGVYGVAALQPQYFFTIVSNDSPVREFRDLAGAVNPGVRNPGQPATLGERVLEYYGLLSPGTAPDGRGARVSIVRPRQGNLADFEAGHMTAATRTQSLRSRLIEEILRTGQYRLVPIRDHDALARSLPGATAGFIPAGLYGPERRLPAEPVPTIAVTQLLVARRDVPGRVVRDILEAIYDPRFARDLDFELSEDAGRQLGGLPLHPAASIYYHRNDLPTSDRLGRLSFVASAIAGLAAAIQFLVRYHRSERIARRRRLLEIELTSLQGIRARLDDCADAETARGLLREADALLCRAEHDAAAGVLDADGIQSLRSLHQVCWRAAWDRIRAQPQPA